MGSAYLSNRSLAERCDFFLFSFFWWILVGGFKMVVVLKCWVCSGAHKPKGYHFVRVIVLSLVLLLFDFDVFSWFMSIFSSFIWFLARDQKSEVFEFWVTRWIVCFILWILSLSFSKAATRFLLRFLTFNIYVLQSCI